MKLGCNIICKLTSWSLLYLLSGFQCLCAQESVWDVGVAVNTSLLMPQKIAESTMLNPGFALWGRLMKDSRYAFKAEVLYRSLASSRMREQIFSGGFVEQRFNRNMVELDAIGEFNLWHFASDYSYKNSKAITPYLLAGASVGISYSETSSGWLAAFPFGCGAKLMLGRSLILGFETAFRFYPGAQLEMFYPSRVSTFLDETRTTSRWLFVPSIRLSWILGRKDGYCIN